MSEEGVAAVGTQVHVLGGYVGGRAHSTTHLVLDTVTGRWRTAAPLPAALDHVGTVAVGGTLYAIGGYGTARHATAAVYAFRDGARTRRAPLPVPRTAAVAVVLAGRIHLVGGKTLSGDTTEHDVYDPVTDRWSTAAALPVAVDHASAAVLGGRIYVAGGRPGAVTAAAAYDPSTDRWTALPPLPEGRSSAAGAAWGGRFVVIGGEDAAETRVFRTVDAFDPATRQWSALPALPLGLQGIGAAVVGDRLYVPGGGPRAGGAVQSNALLILG